MENAYAGVDIPDEVSSCASTFGIDNEPTDDENEFAVKGTGDVALTGDTAIMELSVSPNAK